MGIWYKMKVKVKVAQSCPTLCDPMDYTVHRILQARILEWPEYWSSPEDSPNPGLPHCRRILYQMSHSGSPWYKIRAMKSKSATTYFRVRASFISIYFQFYKFYLTKKNKWPPFNFIQQKLQVIQGKKAHNNEYLNSDDDKCNKSHDILV